MCKHRQRIQGRDLCSVLHPMQGSSNSVGDRQTCWHEGTVLSCLLHPDRLSH